ncbi:uncharacterized protein LOC62_06G008775 [Vanrija pseudolonga]|uniref:Uncharacterized protein n=1 Tax=Vanrija pseudolonga TaxID=143232 RepID=A0AAF1BTV8_9TREE|nr:hypothetical protein LOC62_06G008775 [Vanrija pseudolonga]
MAKRKRSSSPTGERDAAASGNGSSPAAAPTRKTKKSRNNSGSGSGSSSSTPSATPSSSSDSGLKLDFNLVGSNKTYSRKLESKKPLESLIPKIAKELGVSVLGLRLVHVRAGGVEQEIWDDFDLQAVKARAHATKSKSETVRVYSALLGSQPASPAAGIPATSSNDKGKARDTAPPTPARAVATPKSALRTPGNSDTPRSQKRVIINLPSDSPPSTPTPPSRPAPQATSLASAPLANGQPADKPAKRNRGRKRKSSTGLPPSTPASPASTSTSPTALSAPPTVAKYKPARPSPLSQAAHAEPDDDDDQRVTKKAKALDSPKASPVSKAAAKAATPAATKATTASPAIATTAKATPSAAASPAKAAPKPAAERKKGRKSDLPPVVGTVPVVEDVPTVVGTVAPETGPAVATPSSTPAGSTSAPAPKDAESSTIATKKPRGRRPSTHPVAPDADAPASSAVSVTAPAVPTLSAPAAPTNVAPVLPSASQAAPVKTPATASIAFPTYMTQALPGEKTSDTIMRLMREKRAAAQAAIVIEAAKPATAPAPSPVLSTTASEPAPSTTSSEPAPAPPTPKPRKTRAIKVKAPAPAAASAPPPADTPASISPATLATSTVPPPMANGTTERVEAPATPKHQAVSSLATSYASPAAPPASPGSREGAVEAVIDVPVDDEEAEINSATPPATGSAAANIDEDPVDTADAQPDVVEGADEEHTPEPPTPKRINLPLSDDEPEGYSHNIPCALCGKAANHIHRDCPAVASGVGTLRARLEDRRKELAQMKQKAKAKPRRPSAYVTAADIEAEYEESSDSVCDTIKQWISRLTSVAAKVNTGTPRATASPKKPASAPNTVLSRAKKSLPTSAPSTPLSREAVARASADSDSSSSSSTPATGAKANGVNTPDTPFYPQAIHLKALARPRRPGSMSGLSVSDAVIETGDSASESSSSESESTSSYESSESSSESDSNDSDDSSSEAGDIDPADLMRQIMTQPLSKRQKRQARASAASMHPVEAGEAVSDNELSDDETQSRPATQRRGSDSSIGDLEDADPAGPAEPDSDTESEAEKARREAILSEVVAETTMTVEEPDSSASSSRESSAEAVTQSNDVGVEELGGDEAMDVDEPELPALSRPRSFQKLAESVGDSLVQDDLPGDIALREAIVDEDDGEDVPPPRNSDAAEPSSEFVATQVVVPEHESSPEPTPPPVPQPKRRGRLPKKKPEDAEPVPPPPKATSPLKATSPPKATSPLKATSPPKATSPVRRSTRSALSASQPTPRVTRAASKEPAASQPTARATRASSREVSASQPTTRTTRASSREVSASQLMTRSTSASSRQPSQLPTRVTRASSRDPAPSTQPPRGVPSSPVYSQTTSHARSTRRRASGSGEPTLSSPVLPSRLDTNAVIPEEPELDYEASQISGARFQSRTENDEESASIPPSSMPQGAQQPNGTPSSSSLAASSQDHPPAVPETQSSPLRRRTRLSNSQNEAPLFMTQPSQVPETQAYNPLPPPLFPETQAPESMPAEPSSNGKPADGEDEDGLSALSSDDETSKSLYPPLPVLNFSRRSQPVPPPSSSIPTLGSLPKDLLRQGRAVGAGMWTALTKGSSAGNGITSSQPVGDGGNSSESGSDTDSDEENVNEAVKARYAGSRRKSDRPRTSGIMKGW